MPDVTRSDSQRSDSSLRPRVSFNRDVHVKRIVPREGGRTVVGALTGDGNGHLVPTPVRKEKINKSKKELAEEAAQIIQQAGSHRCVSGGFPPDKFYTVPRNRSKHKTTLNTPPSSTLDRKVKRTQSFNIDNNKTSPLNYDSLKRRPKKTCKSPNRGIRDITNLKRSNDNLTKKQLSPIIEVNPRDDYFTEQTNKNDNNDKLADETDSLKKEKSKKEEGKVYLIDIDKAEKISSNSKLSKLFSSKKPKTKAIEELTAPNPPKMLRNRSKSGENLQIRGRTVNTMVRRLNQDSSRPPPKPNPTIIPNSSVQHNNNQPFSYTRGLSPEKYDAGNPIIYAQVVGLGPTKQTIHTAYNRKQFNSDSDEGLGNEESFKKTYTRFGDDVNKKEESPILPKYRHFRSSYDELNEKVNAERGRADGMDAKRSESLSEQQEMNEDFDVPRHDLSTRRDMLESRINRRITEGENRFQNYSSSPSPVVSKTYIKDNKASSGIKKSMYKSTPDIYHMDSRPRTEYEYSYFSLQRNSKNKNGFFPNVDESEDEGFASSLLIGNERQNVGDNNNVRNRMNENTMPDDYQQQRYMQNYAAKNNNSYRERSVDDGSHYDPRIDKNFDKERTILVRDDKKPPKPEKKNRLEKVKQLFTRDNRKKKLKQQQMVPEENLRARYHEYKGDDARRNQDYQKTNKVLSDDSTTSAFQESSYITNRRRLSTPSPSPSPVRERKVEKPLQKSSNSWFKSLDRLASSKYKGDSKSQKEIRQSKNLRFFGDSDSDCPRPMSTLKTKSQSTPKLHKISREPRKSADSSLNHNKPPFPPNSRQHHEPTKNPKRRSRKSEMSSLESSTEGDSSQQSQRSVVYLHAATVGDIPDPIRMKYGKRAASREELSSNVSSRMQPSVKHLSRSFSVLAPWRPNRHGDSDIQEKNNNSTKDLSKGTSTSTLYKKKERMPRENSRYAIREDSKKKSMSVESLRHEKSKKGRKDVHRSMSVPKDDGGKSAGWFRLSKGKHKSDYLT